jgi:two-component system, chemotaxis family, chemotaxis protein CheY
MPGETPLEETHSFPALKALVIHNHAQLRTLQRSLLSSFGLSQVFEAANGSEGIVLIREVRPDFVLCDLSMRPMDGIAFTRAVRLDEDSPNPYVPIIMTVGHTERQIIEAVRDAGVTEIVAQPVTAQKLISRLVEVVERPRPYVRSPTYFGPDRRRRNDERYFGPRRRRDDMPDSIAV